MNEHSPIEMVAYVAERLQELREEFVFLGGAIVGLLVDQPGARSPRVTRDVDATVQASTLSEDSRIGGTSSRSIRQFDKRCQEV